MLYFIAYLAVGFLVATMFFVVLGDPGEDNRLLAFASVMIGWPIALLIGGSNRYVNWLSERCSKGK